MYVKIYSENAIQTRRNILFRMKPYIWYIVLIHVYEK